MGIIGAIVGFIFTMIFTVTFIIALFGTIISIGLGANDKPKADEGSKDTSHLWKALVFVLVLIIIVLSVLTNNTVLNNLVNRSKARGGAPLVI